MRVPLALAALLLVGCGSSDSDSAAQVSPDTTSRPEASQGAESSRPAVRPGEPWVATAWNHLYVLRSDGTDRHVLVPELDTADQNGNYDQPDWSPDGSRLAFAQWAGDIITLWIADVSGSNAQQVASMAERTQRPSSSSYAANRIFVTSGDHDG